MKRITEDYQVETFETGFENFYMDVVKRKDFYEVWIYRENIGAKDYVVGAKFANLEEVVSTAETYLELYDCYSFYDERHF